MPSDVTNPFPSVAQIPTVTPALPHIEDGAAADLTPTAVPKDFVALFATDDSIKPVDGVPMAGTRPVALLTLAVPSPPPPEPPPGEPDVKPPPVIGGHLEPAELIHQTTPVYPHLVKTAGVEGVVTLEGTISVNGSVEDIRVVGGHPMLVDAAVNAVKKWKYRPAILNGRPTPCPVSITVRFNLKYPGD